MPAGITYDEAAACLEGAFYAAAQINPLNPKPGQKALVYGAPGAIGSAYIQFLKYYGAYITAVCRGENKELVTSLGADKVIDYTTADFTRDSERYDFVFDAVGKSSFLKCKKILTRERCLYLFGRADQFTPDTFDTPHGWQEELSFLSKKHYHGAQFYKGPDREKNFQARNRQEISSG